MIELLSCCSVVIRKRERSAQTSVQLEVVQGEAPQVVVDDEKKTVSHNEKTTLKGQYITSTRPEQVYWECIQETGNTLLRTNVSIAFFQ